MSEEVLLQRDFPVEGVATLTLNRPQRGNALTGEMLTRLLALLDELEQDVSVFGVVLTGAGKLFCSGMELRSDKAATLRPESAFARLAAFAKPLIARVNGPCLGGGVGILFCCDVSYIQFSEVLRGLVPALISAVIVPQLGLFKSRQYMMTGEKKGKVSASQLLLDGQLSGVVADEAALDAAVLAASRAFLSAAPNAVQSVKKAVNAVHCAPSEERQRYVQDLFGKMIASPEAAHGMAAFVAKKDPNWPQFAKSRL